MKLECTGGRYPGNHVHNPTAIDAHIEASKGTVRIRIDDCNHLDRWEEFRISIDDLKSLLEEAE